MNTQTAPGARKAALAFIFVTVLIDVIAFGVIIPVLPHLVQEMVGAAFGLGFIVGPLLGGVLGDINHRLPFWCAAGLAMLNFLYGLFVLPESLPPERRTARFDWAHARPLGGVKMLLEHPRIWGLVAVVFIANFAHYVYPSTFVLFADAAFGWKEKQAGYVLAAVGVCSVVVNVMVVGRLVKALGERRAMLLGLLCGATGFVTS